MILKHSKAHPQFYIVVHTQYVTSFDLIVNNELCIWIFSELSVDKGGRIKSLGLIINNKYVTYDYKIKYDSSDA